MTFNPQPLAFKPNFDDAVKRMDAFWQGEIIDRPACGITAPMPGAEFMPGYAYMEGARDDFAVGRTFPPASFAAHICRTFIRPIDL